jgi:hypothetical protein
MAVFDPKTNLRIGVKILKECIDLTGGLEEGLRLYKAGDESISSESDYIGRVLAEQVRLKDALPKPVQASKTPAAAKAKTAK